METVKLYVVQKDDTMAEIARKHGMTVDEFRKMNTGLTDERMVQGMKVKVAVGKQPLKLSEQEIRSEKTKQPLKAQPPQKQAAAQNQPKPAAAPIAKPKAPAASQKMNVTPSNVQSVKKPAAPAAVKSEGIAVKAAQETDFSKVFYPKESQYPMTGEMSGYWNQPAAAAPSAAAGKQPYASAAPEGYPGIPAGPAPQMAPYYPPGPAYQESPSSPYYPASAAPGYPENPAGPLAQTAPYYPLNPASQVSPNPYYSPEPVENPAINPASQVNPYAPAVNGNAAKPYHPAVQGQSAKPVKGPAPQVSPSLFSQQPIKVDQPYTPATGSGAPNPAASPWTNPQMPGPVTAPAFQEQGPPLQAFPKAGKAIPYDPSAIAGYPFPYMPGFKKPGPPCGCGGPADPSLYPPYSPFGPPPVSYYGGNQPPQPVTHNAAAAPAYQQGPPNVPQKKK